MPYGRGEGRKKYRHGVRERTLTTRMGPLHRPVPQLRVGGALKTELLARYQRRKKAFVAARMEMVIHGLSRRTVSRMPEALCGVGFSKSTI